MAERFRDRETETQRDTERHRETQRDTERDAKRETDRPAKLAESRRVHVIPGRGPDAIELSAEPAITREVSIAQGPV